MSCDVSSGAYRIFVGKSQFSAAQIEAAYTAKQIADQDTITNAVNWLQLKTKGALTISRNGEVLELDNEVDGLCDIEIVGRDDWMAKFDMAELSFANLVNLISLDPTQAINFATADTGRGFKLNYSGQSLLNQSFPVLIYRKKYDAANLGDEPKLGAGSDPLAFCFVKMVISERGLEENQDPKGQKIYSVSLKPVAVDGTSELAVGGVRGLLAKLA